jgi:hypothetical protein
MVLDDDKKTTLTKYARAICAQTQNKKNAVAVSPEHKALGAELAELVHNAYIRSRTFTNYTQNSIAIKIERPCIADKMAAAMDGILSAFVSAHDVSIRVIGTSTIYHLPL